VAIAWCATNQSTPTTRAAFEAVATHGAVVPAPFWFEVIYVLVGLSERKLLQKEVVENFLNDVQTLQISIEPAGGFPDMMRLHRLSQQHALSIYDASYLDLALRHELPLSTRDAPLAAAALRVGVQVFGVGRD